MRVWNACGEILSCMEVLLIKFWWLDWAETTYFFELVELSCCSMCPLVSGSYAGASSWTSSVVLCGYIQWTWICCSNWVSLAYKVLMCSPKALLHVCCCLMRSNRLWTFLSGCLQQLKFSIYVSFQIVEVIWNVVVFSKHLPQFCLSTAIWLKKFQGMCQINKYGLPIGKTLLQQLCKSFDYISVIAVCTIFC